MQMYDIMRMVPDANASEAPSAEEATQDTSQEEVQSATEPIADNNGDTVDNVEQGAEYWQQKYKELEGSLASEEFVQKFLETYEETLASREQEVEAFKDHLKAFRTNPKEYLKQYFPEYFEAIGIPQIYSVEEIDTMVANKMTEEFGENWEDAYNPKEIIRKGSLSAKMNQRYEALYKEFQSQNEMAEQKRLEYTKQLASGKKEEPKAPEIDQEAYAENLSNLLTETYEKELAPMGVTEDEFLAFVEECQTYQPTVMDIWKMKNLQKEVEKAKKAGYEEGRRSLSKDMQAAGKLKAVKEEFKPAVPQSADDELSWYDKQKRKAGRVF